MTVSGADPPEILQNDLVISSGSMSKIDNYRSNKSVGREQID
jgi:hypothetical protein